MPDPQDWQLIDRYLAGEASPDEVALVHTRTRADPAWAQALDVLRTDFTPKPALSEKTDEAWTRLRSRLATQPSQALAPAPTSAKQPWLRIAAAVVIVAGSLTTWRLVTSRQPTPNATAFANDINTPNGTRQTVMLGDGSRVTLNAGSRLRWAADFGTRTRDVYLDGEAYFAVSHDATKPFRVHARNTVAHDLGTRFTVRAYPELTHVEVMVAEGSVSLRHDRTTADSAILAAGQLGRLGATGSPTIESNVPVDRWTAWTGGALVLEGLTLAEAAPQLDRRYDVRFTIADSSLARRRVQARFHDETLPQVLDALSLALGARWQQSGRAVTISPAAR
jgi:transmembrane sensor